jgi:hypothetical protein
MRNVVQQIRNELQRVISRLYRFVGRGFCLSSCLLDQTGLCVRERLSFSRAGRRVLKLSRESLIDAVLVLWRHWHGRVWKDSRYPFLKYFCKRTKNEMVGLKGFASFICETAESLFLRLWLSPTAPKGIPILNLFKRRYWVLCSGNIYHQEAHFERERRELHARLASWQQQV